MTDFAQALGVSMDTAKRWLSKSWGSQFVQVLKTQGGHWRVHLPKGQYSLVICRLCRTLDLMVQRKPYARRALPMGGEYLEEFLSAPSQVKTSFPGVSAPLLRWDLGSLLVQTAQELNCPLEAIFSRGEEAVQERLGYLVLLNAIMRLQKAGKPVNAGTVANELAFSEASLYRKPFGSSVLHQALATAGALPHQDEGMTTSHAQGEGFALKGQRTKRPYSERKEAAARRREAKARYFLCWLGNGSTGTNAAASLRLIPESQVPAEIRPSFPQDRIKVSLPAYSGNELAGILLWLKCHGHECGEMECVGKVIHVKGRGFVWLAELGACRTGEADTWESALAQVMHSLEPKKATRRVIVLNPLTKGLYLAPTALPPQPLKKRF